VSGKRQIEARWGIDFWQLVSDFADQGLTRFDTARALGYRPDSFCKMLTQNPKRDPFDEFLRAQAYFKDTGETLRQALERMALERRSWGYAARAIGYADGSALKRAAVRRGVTVEMNSKHPGRPRKHPIAPKRGDLTLNWPSWEKIYEIGGGPVPQQRRKKV